MLWRLYSACSSGCGASAGSIAITRSIALWARWRLAHSSGSIDTAASPIAMTLCRHGSSVAPASMTTAPSCSPPVFTNTRPDCNALSQRHPVASASTVSTADRSAGMAVDSERRSQGSQRRQSSRGAPSAACSRAAGPVQSRYRSAASALPSSRVTAAMPPSAAGTTAANCPRSMRTPTWRQKAASIAAYRGRSSTSPKPWSASSPSPCGNMKRPAAAIAAAAEKV